MSEKVSDVDLKGCPLCKHKADMFIGEENGFGHEVDVVRCRYCGCRVAVPHVDDVDRNVKMLSNMWNNRVEYCQFCGALVGSRDFCANCGSTLAVP